jgi:hypothetical protein
VAGVKEQAEGTFSGDSLVCVVMLVFVDRRRDPREPITYKDLDAPEDIY